MLFAGYGFVSIAFCFILLWALGYYYAIYPIGMVEQYIDPHMYYIRQFVHSLPPEIQADMTIKATAMDLDIYSYNLQMCTVSDDYFK